MVIPKLHVLDCGLHISPKKRVKGSTLSRATWTIFNMGSPVSGTNIKIHLQELKLILIFAFCAMCMRYIVGRAKSVEIAVSWVSRSLHLPCQSICLFLVWFLDFFGFYRIVCTVETTWAKIKAKSGRWGYRIQKVGRLPQRWTKQKKWHKWKFSPTK